MVYSLQLTKNTLILFLLLLCVPRFLQAQFITNDYLIENQPFEKQQKKINRKVTVEQKRKRRARRRLERQAKRKRKTQQSQQQQVSTNTKTRALGNYQYQEDLADALYQEGKEVYMFDIIKHAKKYIGVPYKWGGKTPIGFDCSGFTQYVFRQGGFLIPRVSRQQAKHGKRIRIKRAEKGDLIFFGKRRRRISHVGLVISERKKPLTMIHASSSKGISIVDVTKSRYWRKKLRKARRVIH